MAADNQRGRVWDRPRSARNGPVAGFLISALAVFGAAMIGLAIANGSMTAAGAKIDGWIEAARTLIR